VNTHYENLRKHCNSTPRDAVNSRSDNNVSSIKSLKARQILHSKAHCSNITKIIITVYKPSRNSTFSFNKQKALGDLITSATVPTTRYSEESTEANHGCFPKQDTQLP